MKEQFILLNHPEGDCKLYVGSIPPPPEEAIYAAKIQAGETADENIGRCLLMLDEMFQEADRRGLPDEFPVALMREEKDIGEGKFTLGEAHTGFLGILDDSKSEDLFAIAEYWRLKLLKSLKS